MKTTLITLFCVLLCVLPYGRKVYASPLSSPLSSTERGKEAEPHINLPPSNREESELPTPPMGTSSDIGWMSSLEFWLSICVLAFGLLAILVELKVIINREFKPDDAIKMLAVTLIVISTLFIITAGFDSEQIAPAMGLFGTVAGYMLGKSTTARRGE